MTVGVVSPHSITRKALCALLGSIPQVKVVMDAGNPLEDVVVLQRVRPGILLFDSLNPVADLENLVRTRKVLPEVKSLLLTARVDDELVLRAIKAGAQGCISREADPEALTKALETLSRGDFWVSHRMASRIIGEFVRTREKTDRVSDRNELSRREWQIVTLVAQGLRNKHIAQQLFVCESTIKTHLYSIYRKLEIGSRLEATLYYYQYLKSGTGDDSVPPVRPETRPAVTSSGTADRPAAPGGLAAS